MRRARDYSISKSSNSQRQAKYQFGQADNHLTFIRNDVIKFIESNYRTNPSNRTYFGFPLGAYLVLTP
ncbi:alpha/beta hydrolase-fold protein [Pseudoalteromonas sp. '520P1 No. 423']|uniref:alpha/beta hydrolase-fold protein n=1 Tax=unclassified Pseudoalteromonas TaxID=194690 RepID=UPI003529C7FA